MFLRLTQSTSTILHHTRLFTSQFNPLNYKTKTNMSAAYTTVSTPDAPGAIGPYSQAIKTDSLIFLSGCIPLDPVSMKVVEGGVEEQTVSWF